MSRLWADRLRIGLAPQRVEVIRVPPGFGKKPVAENSIACASASGQPPWRAALDALDTLLAGIGSRPADATVVLSNHFARYEILPWQEEVTGAAELAAAARYRFERTFGDAVQGWEIRQASTDYGAPGLACAIDTELLAALTERLNRKPLRLVSVQPLLASAYNSLRNELDPSGALAVIEPGRICLSLFSEGRWQHVSSRRMGAGDPADAVEQEIAAAAADSAPSHLDVLPVGPGIAWTQRGSLPARVRGRFDGRQCPLAACGGD